MLLSVCEITVINVLDAGQTVVDKNLDGLEYRSFHVYVQIQGIIPSIFASQSSDSLALSLGM